jgi:2-polyprenyl-3-methyl-5-hydroxy-6-metoxy-1,4-benzoquinol methylase
VNCKVCHGTSLKKLYFLHNYQIWQCESCGFGQVDVTAQELAAFYDKAYFGGEKARWGQAADEDITPSHTFWLERQLRLTGADRPLRILDIGPGLGVGFGKYIRAHHPNMSYEAVEISDYAAASLQERGYTVHHGRCADPHVLEACRGRFDLIVGTEVIEHDPEPHEFVSSVYSMLKSGGRCAFTTGNLKGLVARKQGSKWYYLDPPAHVSYYTPKAAEILFSAEGFTEVDNWKVGFSYITLSLKTHIPGILALANLLSLPTGMVISARRP